MKKATFKKIFKCIFNAAGIFSAVCVIIILSDLFSSNDYVGQIKKTSENREYKYVSHTFLVDFGKLGLRAIEVSPGDFLRFEKGTYITWSYSKYELNPTFNSLETVVFTLFFIVYFSCFVVLYLPEIVKSISCFLNEHLED